MVVDSEALDCFYLTYLLNRKKILLQSYEILIDIDCKRLRGQPLYSQKRPLRWEEKRRQANSLFCPQVESMLLMDVQGCSDFLPTHKKMLNS